MKIILIIALLSFTCLSYSQINIDQNDMPNPGDTFRVSNTTILQFDGMETGSDYTWDYSDLGFTTQSVDTFVSISSTLPAYILIFGNILDPNKATIASPNADSPTFIQQVQVTDSYDFFRESSSGFVKNGFGAKINEIPTPIKYDSPELYFTFPVTYLSADSSSSYFGFEIPDYGYFGQQIDRKNEVDGWGTLITPYGTFDVIRVKSTINITDTIYYSAYGIGTQIPRPTEYEYKWMGDNQGIPLLDISVRNFTNTVTYRDSVRSTTVGLAGNAETGQLVVFPNPGNGKFKISTGDYPGVAEIYDNSGRVIKKFIVECNETEVALPAGSYYIRLSGKKSVAFSKIFVVK